MENEKDDEHKEDAVLAKFADLAGTAITGIPAPVRKGLAKAVERLCLAAVDYPATYLETLASERRAAVAARTLLASKVAEKIAAGMDVPVEASQAAARIWTGKILGRQSNLDAVVKYAVQHSAAEAAAAGQVTSEGSEPADIDEDWLNVFEREAENASSEQLRVAFGRILAGEASRPGEFSPRTVRILAQLPQDTAKDFQNLCGMATVIRNVSGSVSDARMWTLGKPAGQNGLSDFGLSFVTCMELVDAGLLSPELNSGVNYQGCTVEPAGNMTIIMSYRGVDQGLVWRAPENYGPIQIEGIALTRAGRELLQVVDAPENHPYTAARRAYLEGLGLDLALLDWVEPGARFRWKLAAPAKPTT